MGRAKEIIVKVIPSKIANDFVKKQHYSNKIAATAELHFGCFLDKKLIGVVQYGRPINKYLHINLVNGTKWNEFLELNRMVMLNDTPKNTESRILAITFKLIKKNAEHIKWVMTFADAIQCGDGTIYRASGFKLIAINKSQQLYVLPDSSTMHLMGLQGGNYGKHRKDMLKKGYTSAKKYMTEVLKGVQLKGQQIKYIKLLKNNLELNCKILPFSEIDKQGAGMYKGEKITLKERKENKRD
tara:strand:- start:80 stop:802 length:723 start_codon:yes stop_codon:yes gene_type:complete